MFYLGVYYIIEFMNNPADYAGRERRKYKRLSYWTTARYRNIEKDSEFRSAAVENISIGGLLIKTKSQSELHEIFEIELYIPYIKGFRLVKVKAKSLWQKKDENNESYSMGFGFTHLEDDSKNLLNDFINHFENEDVYSLDFKDKYLHIPYWCLLDYSIILDDTLGAEKGINTYEIVFESKNKILSNSAILISLKVPTIKMPFKAKGLVTDIKEQHKDLAYSVFVMLYNLNKEQIDGLIKFSKE